MQRRESSCFDNNSKLFFCKLIFGSFPIKIPKVVPQNRNFIKETKAWETLCLLQIIWQMTGLRDPIQDIRSAAVIVKST